LRQISKLTPSKRHERLLLILGAFEVIEVSEARIKANAFSNISTMCVLLRSFYIIGNYFCFIGGKGMNNISDMKRKKRLNLFLIFYFYYIRNRYPKFFNG